MTSVKAALTVTLRANDVVVAEVEDAALWQRILNAINDGKSHLEPVARVSGLGSQPGGGTDKNGENGGTGGGTTPVDLLAAELAIDAAVFQGACAPNTEPPYMHLDLHCWEVMKKQLAQRGPTAISPIVVPATLLGLWFKKAGLGNPTQAQAQAVLATINVTDKNSSRAIQNTSWLQGRPGGQVVLNPAEISKAIKLGKCFCTKDWSAWKEQTKS